MFKPANILVLLILFLLSSWFYSKMMTPQSDSRIRVTNLPWQITLPDQHTLRVFDLDIGKATLEQAVVVLKSEYELAWFDNADQSISLEAYFLRVNLSGLRAKVVLELDTEKLDTEYLKKNSGKPKILASRAIKYPIDDLAQELANRVIRSLTYVPKSSVAPDLIKNRFGQPEELIILDENTEFWLYPQKGLVITMNKKGKEAFQYVPVSNFERLRKTIKKT